MSDEELIEIGAEAAIAAYRAGQPWVNALAAGYDAATLAVLLEAFAKAIARADGCKPRVKG